MAYLALYRKYRPDSFDDVVGQEKVIKVISNAIINNKVSHAYLFSGPRGTGKTTTAKIIAKMVNCENLIDGKPCNECDSCKNILNSSDIVEIDAASNNGVDEIRDIRDKVNLVPASCKYKVYIIDEVHMLTTQAFNALLKTLEEPPKHVIFILATTEFYKIPLTVTSRCQKFLFTKIDDVDIVRRLGIIAKNENISIENDALFEVARLSDGGLRDAINMLDQLTAYQSDTIKLDDVYKISGSVSYIDLNNLFINLLDSNNNDIINFIEDIDKNGKNLVKFVEEIIIFLKDILIYKNTNNLSNIEEKNKIIMNLADQFTDDIIFTYIYELNDLLIKMKTANYPAILLVVTLLKLSKKNENNDIVNKCNVIEESKEIKLDNDNVENANDNIANNTFNNNKVNDNVKVFSDEKKKIRINNTLAGAKKEILMDIKAKWNKISDYLLDEKFSSVAGLLTDVNPIVASSNYLMLECKYEANADRINEQELDISKLLEDIYNISFNVVAISSDRWNVEKEKYVNDRKKGIVYSIIEEEKDENEVSSKKDEALSKLVDLLGDDIIEYR